MNKKVAVAIFLVALGVIAGVYFGFRPSEPVRTAPLSELGERFIAILPDDLPPGHRAEIDGLLRRFEARARANRVRPEDYQEVMQLIAGHLTKGSLTRDELNLVMAKVGYYSHRALSPDSSDIHPLLDPTEYEMGRRADSAHVHPED